MDSINDDAAKRIATIEAKLLLYKKGILVLFLLFISLIVMGGIKSNLLKYDELLVKKLILVDDNDIPKIILVANTEFSGLIVVGDKMEKQVTVGTNSTGPSVAVYDKNDKVRGALTYVKETPGIALYRPDGKPTIAVTSQSEGPGIYLYDKFVNPMVSLGSGEDGSSKLAFYDSKNIMRAAISYGGNKPMVTIFNERKELIFKAPK